MKINVLTLEELDGVWRRACLLYRIVVHHFGLRYLRCVPRSGKVDCGIMEWRCNNLYDDLYHSVCFDTYNTCISIVVPKASKL